MAMITCPECGANVSSEAESCPTCGRPINTKSKRRSRSSGLRTGAVIGLIGGIGLIAVLLISLYLGAASESRPEADITINVTTTAGEDKLISSLGLALPLVPIPLFIAAVIGADRFNRTTAIALSSASLVISAAALVLMAVFLNVLSICLGWLFLWQPVLEIIGAIKMLSNALRYEG